MPKVTAFLRDEGKEKLRELILYICQESEGDDGFGSVKLNKLLFYSDFGSFLDNGKPVTGVEYQALDQGPAPRIMLPLLEEMAHDGEIVIREEPYHGYTKKRPIALRQANLSQFTAEEIAAVSHEIKRFWGIGGKVISEMSHKFIGWQVANIGETIPYSLALLEDRELTQEELAYGRQLAATITPDLIAQYES